MTPYLISHVAEQAYLHFDKPYYAAGDTMYFKAYVTMAERHLLSQLSGVLHVELINTKNKIDQSILLKIRDGVCWGDFPLRDTLPKGKYRVRAYTNWMRNGGESAFFEHVFSIGSPLAHKVAEAGQPQAAGKPDFQFFPEGGNFMVGLKSKVAFKAVGANGLGLAAKGAVTDNNGKTIAAFESAHLGMGYFEMTPEAGKSYKASVSFADGSQNTIDLPAPLAAGVCLTVNNDSLQKTTVTIRANALYFQQNRNKEYSILIYSGGIITTVNCKLDSPETKLDIVKRRLHTGVNTVTLFSQNGEPLCERLFFVQKYDKLNLSVNSDKTTYLPREKVNIKLNAKNRADSVVSGHFSVSIIDESKVPVDENTENTILSSLLLTDDLKGNIEQPNYYFNNITDGTLKSLDLVMLTHGYRRFEWKKVLTGSNLPAIYQPENNLEIAGIAKTIGGSTLAGGTVSLISPVGGPVLSEKTDNQGNFTFRNLEFMDSTHFVLQAVGLDGKNKTKLVYKTAAFPDVTVRQYASDDVNQQMLAYLDNRGEQLAIYKKNDMMAKAIQLQEVKIRAIRQKENYRSSVLGGPGHSDQVVFMKDIPPGPTMVDKLNGWLHGIVLSNGTANYLGVQMTVIVDGVMMNNRFSLNDLSPDDVESVEVLKTVGMLAIYGIAAGNGILVVNTKIGEKRDMKDIPSFGVLPIIPAGYHVAREFYSPKYDTPSSGINRKDLRASIFWNPELLTDKDGNASINFYNADAPGSYRLVIEGIDDKGNLGRQVYRYTVK